MVAGAGVAGTANQHVQMLQAGDQLHRLVFAQGRKFGAETAAQDVAGCFGDLHAEGGGDGDVFATIVGIGFDGNQAFALQDFQLAANAGFGLAQGISDGFLLYARVPLQHQENLELAQTDAKLFLQDLFGLFAEYGCQMLNQIR